MDSFRPLIIIPTYNERQNLSQLLPVLLERYSEIHILVVDDNSPDGTASWLEAVMRDPSWGGRVHLLLGEKKAGLARAYLRGFAWGLDGDYTHFVEMDADFSHRPEDLGRILDALRSSLDVVVGSRWVAGGGTVNWSSTRKWISRFGSWYSSRILGGTLLDWTGGFNGWSRKALLAIGLHRVQSQGYSFQIELKQRAIHAGMTPTEVPIIFSERVYGQSKMSGRIVVEALFRVLKLRWQISGSLNFRK